MITFDELRQSVISYEKNFTFNLMESDGSTPEALVQALSEIEDELSEADCVEDIATYYCNSGFDLHEAYENIVKVLMSEATIRL